MRGCILLISGPSGSGKSTLLKALGKKIKNTYFSVSTTTRKKRIKEQEGINYHYISVEEFQKGIEENKFLEWAKVHENFYGTSLELVEKALSKEKLVIFDIDVQGYKLAREKMGDIITSVFIATPTRKELKKRLLNRKTDTAKVINQRMINAEDEMREIQLYDYLLINDNFKETLRNLLCIAKISKYKSTCYNSNELIYKWTNKKGK